MQRYKLVTFFMLGLMVASCDSDQLAIGTKVTITPSEQKVAIIAGNPIEAVSCSTGEKKQYQDVPILISVTNSIGAPVGGAEVILYADYSDNTFSGPDLLQIYADKNGNGVVDIDTELVSGIDAEAYVTKTVRYEGTAMLFVRMNLTCPYRGSLKAFVGSSVAVAEFEVTVQEEVIMRE